MKLLIADDHLLLAQVLSSSLADSGIDCSISTDFSETVSCMRDTAFDVVLLDVNMPGMRGIHSIKQVCDTDQNAKVVLFSSDLAKNFVEMAVDVGVFGFIPKSIKRQSLLSVLTLIESGQKYLPAELLQSAEVGAEEFCDRDIEVIKAVSNGATNKEIALFYSCSEANIKAHIRNLCIRLSARNRAHLVTKARSENII